MSELGTFDPGVATRSATVCLSAELEDLPRNTRMEAIGYQIAISAWAISNAPSGNLTPNDLIALPLVLGWTGSSEDFLEILLRLGVLTQTGESIVISDWKRPKEIDGQNSEILSRSAVIETEILPTNQPIKTLPDREIRTISPELVQFPEISTISQKRTISGHFRTISEENEQLHDNFVPQDDKNSRVGTARVAHDTAHAGPRQLINSNTSNINNNIYSLSSFYQTFSSFSGDAKFDLNVIEQIIDLFHPWIVKAHNSDIQKPISLDEWIDKQRERLYTLIAEYYEKNSHFDFIRSAEDCANWYAEHEEREIVDLERRQADYEIALEVYNKKMKKYLSGNDFKNTPKRPVPPLPKYTNKRANMISRYHKWLQRAFGELGFTPKSPNQPQNVRQESKTVQNQVVEAKIPNIPSTGVTEWDDMIDVAVRTLIEYKQPELIPIIAAARPIWYKNYCVLAQVRNEKELKEINRFHRLFERSFAGTGIHEPVEIKFEIAP